MYNTIIILYDNMRQTIEHLNKILFSNSNINLAITKILLLLIKIQSFSKHLQLFKVS